MSFPFESRPLTGIRRHKAAGAATMPERKRYLHRVDTPTTVGVYAGFAPAGTPGNFSPGNATIGQRGTIPGSDWFEMVQEELITVATAAGIAPVKGALSQLWQAILSCSKVVDIGIAANTCIANPVVAVTSLVDGMAVNILVANTNTAAATFNLSGLGGLAVVRPDGSILQPGDLTANQIVGLIYSSASPQWRLRSFPARIRLSGNLNLYVNSASGSDTNNGLSVGLPFATMNKAYTWLQQNVDLGGWQVTVNCAGTTLAPLSAVGTAVGAVSPLSIVFLGNASAPSAVQVNASNLFAFAASNGAMISVNGFQISSSGSLPSGGCGLAAFQSSQLAFNNIIFGVCGLAHLYVTQASVILGGSATYTITGGAVSHLFATNQAQIQVQNATVTLSGTPAFTTYADAVDLGFIYAAGMGVASGTATGSRYGGNLNSLIDTNGGGASFFPGSTSGALATGALYN